VGEQVGECPLDTRGGSIEVVAVDPGNDGHAGADDSTVTVQQLIYMHMPTISMRIR
jgi:hypothetical protein